MIIKFESLQSNRYVMNPCLEKGNRLSFVEKGCTHYFVISTKRGNQVDMKGEAFRLSLEKIGADLCLPEKTKDKMIDDFPGTRVTCIDRNTYLREGSLIQLPQRAASYWVFGGVYRSDDEYLEIYFPEDLPDALNTQVEVKCRIAAVEEQKKGFFKKTSNLTGYYAILIDKLDEYTDGGIVYRVNGCHLEGEPIEYSVTQEMLGVRFFVKSNGTPPVFISKLQGLELKQIVSAENMIFMVKK